MTGHDESEQVQYCRYAEQQPPTPLFELDNANDICGKYYQRAGEG